MKKLFTLCAAMLMGSAMAFGQVDQTFQFVDKDGNVVADGTTWTVSEKVDSVVEFPTGPVDMGTMILSGLYVKNTSDEDVLCSIDYQVTQLSGGTFQICFPGTCSSAGKVMDEPLNKDMSAESVAPGAVVDLESEWVVRPFGSDVEATGTCTATLQLKVMNPIEEGAFVPTVKAYGPKITVVFSNNGTTGIGSVEAVGGKKVEAYYSLSGRRLSVPQKGLNIVKFADGTARKVVVR